MVLIAATLVPAALPIGSWMRHAPLETIAIETCLDRLPDWEQVAVDGVVRIERTFTFADQGLAHNFTQLLGEVADASNHHPSLLMQRQSVTVAWWTFSLGTLSKIDFVMAERTDRLFDAMESESGS